MHLCEERIREMASLSVVPVPVVEQSSAAWVHAFSWSCTVYPFFKTMWRCMGPGPWTVWLAPSRIGRRDLLSYHSRYFSSVKCSNRVNGKCPGKASKNGKPIVHVPVMRPRESRKTPGWVRMRSALDMLLGGGTTVLLDDR